MRGFFPFRGGSGGPVLRGRMEGFGKNAMARHGAGRSIRKRSEMGREIGDQETQRPAICASGDCPMALTIGSQPSSRRGLGAGVPVGAFVSAGLFTALWLFTGTRGMRSLLSARLIVSVVWPAEGAAVVAETSRPMRYYVLVKAAPPKPARYDWLRMEGSHDPYAD